MTYEKLDKNILKFLPKRNLNFHKGDCGRVLIVGGNIGMWGAVALAARAALRVGAGMVHVLTRDLHKHCITQYTPEVMSYGIETMSQAIADIKEYPMLTHLLTNANVIALGPGLGQCSWAKELFEHVVNLQKKTVVDADALNFLSNTSYTNDQWILTPHEGEAARLLNVNLEQVKTDRQHALVKIQQKYHGTVVLKGSGTLIASNNSKQTPAICNFGNPGMATAGMGDVLTGIIAGIVAQGIALNDAAKLGVYIHARAGDMAAKNGERGLIASDLFEFVRKIIN